MSVDYSELCSAWALLKQAEKEAAEKRREIEDQLTELMNINIADEKVNTSNIGDFVVKATTRLTRKVDSELVQEIAQEYGITEYLHSLFRWKPEIDLKAWKAVDADITNKLTPAITVSAGRPSFSIIKKG